MLQVKGVDCVYVGTIRFDSLSLITPAIFSLSFLLLFRMSCQSHSSIVAKFRACRFFIRQMKKTGWVFVVSLQFSCEWPQLLT